MKIINLIDRRITLEEIAKSLGMELEEVIEEMETIVSSGLKLNLNYYIDQEVDQDVIGELMDYFTTQAQSDSVEQAMEELGNDYTEKEIRLVRLKFLCEVAS